MIAHQGLEIDHQPRWHAKFSFHTRQVAALAVHGVDDDDALIHQLRQVFVAAADHHVHALLGGGDRQRANDVVSLYVGHGKHFPAEQRHHLMDGRYLRTQVVGHGAAALLVFGVKGVAEGGAGGIKHAHGKFGRLLTAQRLHHVDHSAYRASRRAGRVARHRTQVGHGVEGAVEVAGAVYQQQGLVVAHGAIVHRTQTLARLAGCFANVRLTPLNPACVWDLNSTAPLSKPVVRSAMAAHDSNRQGLRPIPSLKRSMRVCARSGFR